MFVHWGNRPSLETEIKSANREIKTRASSVTLRGEHIAGSPFSAQVSVPHADARQCRLAGLGLREAVAGEPAQFRIDFADVAHVLQYDVATNAVEFMHRILVVHNYDTGPIDAKTSPLYHQKPTPVQIARYVGTSVHLHSPT